MTTVLRAESIGMHIEGRTLFSDVNLHAQKGAILAVTGPNGTGKTTLLRVLHKLTAPTTGAVHYARPDLRVSMVFQKPMMLATTVLENVAYPLKQAGQSKHARRDRAAELLREAGLSHLADRIATMLSGGEQQRVAMIRALAVDPDVLLLDEPTAHLDDRATETTEEWLLRWRREISIILVSHDAEQVRRLADEQLKLTLQPRATSTFQPASHQGSLVVERT